jgi:hypothetical protein
MPRSLSNFALYISRGPPIIYFKPKISEIDPLLDEKSLFVRVPGLSGVVVVVVVVGG